MERENNKKHEGAQGTNRLQAKRLIVGQFKQMPPTTDKLGQQRHKQQLANKMVATKLGAENEAQLQQQQQQQQQQQRKLPNGRLIKKAYVRFDDYLDLNEENMRRSCKRLMNHLYSESTTTVLNCCPIAATPSRPMVKVAPEAAECSLRLAKSPLGGHKSTGAPTSGGARSSYQVSGKNQTTTNQGKSYLRSQYERRQLRQLELVNKMRREDAQAVSSRGNCTEGGQQIGATGATARRQQQDLVAKSHELSKRRFFERLERRESSKNLALSSEVGKKAAAAATNLYAQAACSKQAPSNTGSTAPVTEQTANKGPNSQKSLAAITGDDQLMLRVYRSIALEDKANCAFGGDDGGYDGPLDNLDTLERLAGKAVGASIDCNKESVGELIGFYTPSPQSPVLEGEQHSSQPAQQRLIDFSTGQEWSPPSSDGLVVDGNAVEGAALSSALRGAGLKERDNCVDSKFEIRVPAFSINDRRCRDSTDHYQAGGLLVVKQVSVAEIGKEEKQEPAGQLTGLSGRCDGAFGQMSANKTRTFASVDLAGNKIDSTDSATHKVDADRALKTMDTVEAATIIESNQPLSSPVDRNYTSDNQHQALAAAQMMEDINSTISSNESSRGNNVEQNSQALSAAASVAVNKAEETTTASREEALRKSSAGSEVDGAKFAGDSEAPETALLVGQSGGAESALTISQAAALNHADGLAYPVQTRSAAQEQQVAAESGCNKGGDDHSRVATITNLEIRDVPPEANGIIPDEASVNGKYVAINDCNKEKLTSATAIISDAAHQPQGNQPMGLGLSDEYVNSVHGALSGAHEISLENNVIHITIEQARTAANAERTHIDLLGGGKHLTESNVSRPVSLEVKQVREVVGASVEEDGGSSCSSSGFGASVSVTSSSDGRVSTNDTVSVVSEIKREQSEPRQPTSLSLTSRSNNRQLESCALYNSVRAPRNKQRILLPQVSNEFPGYKQLVGPDQAYPTSRTLLVENHGYATILNQCDSDRADSGITLERDSIVGGYVNLQRKLSKTGDYATICTRSNNKRLSKATSNVSISEPSRSTTSADSGGFSTLPPARIDCSSANNFDSIVSTAGLPRERKSSILKRFGSLVSKAFAGAGGAQSAASKISESQEPLPALPLAEGHQQILKSSAAHTGLKSAIVIGKDHQVASQKEQLSKADLVILPAKKVNQPKLNQSPLQQERNRIAKYNDDRLSRENNRARNTKKNSPPTSASSSSYSSSSSSNATSRHPKRADSLSDELESLMSRSECSKHQGPTSFAGETSNGQMTARDRIDIDCVAPASAGKLRGLKEREYPTNALESAAPHSILNLSSLNYAQRAAESTPNLTSSSRVCNRSTEITASSSAAVEDADDTQNQQPISGFWGFSSLIGQSHATIDRIPDALKGGRKPNKPKKNLTKPNRIDCDELNELDSLMYTALQPFTIGYKLHSTEREQPNRCQSLGLYQNLLRNYAKRRHHRHRHHHHHQRDYHLSSRHAHNSTRCGQSWASPSTPSSESSETACKEKSAVRGQLIKINKSDGSQVIELQRSPGKSWGFFVARGAIDNVKGKMLGLADFP